MHGFLGTKADFWWDVTLTTETVVLGAFLLGYRYAKRRQGASHQRAMLISTVMVTGWLAMYIAQQIIAGLSGFDGPEGVKLFVYYPTIIFHSLVSTVAILLSVYQLYGGFKSSRTEGGRLILTGKGAGRHRKVGMVTLLCYLFSVVTAYIIYFMLFVLYAPLRVAEYGVGQSVGIFTAILGVMAGIIAMGAWLFSRNRRLAA